MDIVASAENSSENLASWHKINQEYSPLFGQVFDFRETYAEEDERTCLDRARNNYGYACQQDMQFKHYTKEFYLETAREHLCKGKLKSEQSVA